MKALFGRPGRAGPSNVASTGIQPASYAHASLERRLTITPTADGLLVSPRPSHPRHAHLTVPPKTRPGLLKGKRTEAAEPDRKLAPPAPPIRIAWGREARIAELAAAEAKSLTRDVDEASSIQAYGIVGILRVFKHAYLLVITSRALAGSFFHPRLPVYRCSGVLAIPLDQALATPILRAEHARQGASSGSSSDSSSDSDSDSDAADVEKDDVVTPSLIKRESFIGSAALNADAADSSGASATIKAPKKRDWTPILQQKARALSEGGDAIERDSTPAQEPTAEQATAQGASSGPTEELGETDRVAVPGLGVGSEASVSDDGKELSADEQWHEATKAELEEKLVREAARMFARGEMWFAYDFDLTTSLQRKHELAGQVQSTGTSSLPFVEPLPTVPLHKRVDRRFWYNEHLQKDLVEAKLHAYILPIMQGFFQVTQLPIQPARTSMDAGSSIGEGDAMDAATEAAAADDVEAHFMIISRRSKERAGLRYQRRGVNDDGQVANYNETEQVAYVRRGAATNLLSFVQIRGSIPLFWRQDGLSSIKPAPLLERNDAQNVRACKAHFEAQVKRFANVTCVNLAEQHGKEGQLTDAFRKRVEEDIGMKDTVKYMPFDFHKECAGMKFENVARLVDKVEDTFKAMGYFHASKETSAAAIKVSSQQRGVFRVNCVDCLDRTNVVQSAFGRAVLNRQLATVGVPGGGPANEDFEFCFNDTWANNGDMISQAYASTRALKGDFTRTGKRNIFGMMNDATASVYRMVRGAISDYFRQTAIDFVQGNLTLAGLERYNDELAAQDPSERVRLARVRADAIESCASVVLGEGEERLGGWTLFSPIDANKVHGSRFEEKVILLTNKALYSCGYDFTSETLAEVSKVLLGDIVGIKKGLYIISPNEAYHPEDNWGMLVEYLAEERRLNNASIRNMPPASSSDPTHKFLALRAVRTDDNDQTVSMITKEHDTSSDEQRKSRQRGGNKEREKAAADEAQVAVLTPRQTIDKLVAMLAERCKDAGAVEDESTFVQDETIQSLAQAKANASLFAPLLEGLKRRLWL